MYAVNACSGFIQADLNIGYFTSKYIAFRVKTSLSSTAFYPKGCKIANDYCFRRLYELIAGTKTTPIRAERIYRYYLYNKTINLITF